MGRVEGSLNKPKLPIGLDMSEDERLILIANLILEIITEEQLL